jgi:alkyl sulfatase BDS1-like metallo-beta-lactamase superfamily hydrolase
MTLHNGVLVHTRTTRPADNADLSLTLTKPQLLALLAGKGLHGVYHSGDLGVLDTLLSLLDDNDPDFAIVTP